jgi:hypothetical protein
MGGDGNRREGFALKDRGRQADCFADRIVVVACLRRFDSNVLHLETIQQVPG